MQRALREAKFTSTAGAVVGVITGCCLGMINLLFIDLGSSERQRQAAELKVRKNSTKRGRVRCFTSVGAERSETSNFSSLHIAGGS